MSEESSGRVENFASPELVFRLGNLSVGALFFEVEEAPQRCRGQAGGNGLVDFGRPDPLLLRFEQNRAAHHLAMSFDALPPTIQRMAGSRPRRSASFTSS